MFNNIIYFIIVLLIFSVNYAELAPPFSPLTCGVVIVLCWSGFAAICRLQFGKLFRIIKATGSVEGNLTQSYYSTITRLSIFAIVLFAVNVYLLNIKYWLNQIPLFRQSALLQGLSALAIFFFYLCTIWFFSHGCYRLLFGAQITRRGYVIGQFRFNFPILFPWIGLSLIYDLMGLSKWPQLNQAFDSPGGQLLFFGLFLGILMTFMPRWVQYWWGCSPLEDNEKTRALRRFLAEQKFRYRQMLRWPVFEGRMLTAGIMGIIGRYRYILLTDALLEILTVEELKAVLAHEMGHARYRHLLFYIIFFAGFVALSFGLFDIFFYLVASQSYFLKVLSGQGGPQMNLFYLALSIPMLISLVVYFRYIMGFFMRNFERQADLYSAKVMGTPRYTIDSLEKIALWSGKSRDVPSWHHFSIRERVDCLKKMIWNPSVFKRHNRFVLRAFLIYILCIGALSYELNFTGATDRFSYGFLTKILEQRASTEPGNLAVREALAMLYHTMGRIEEAEQTYRKIITIDPKNTVALNNLAWILATNVHASHQDRQQALELAKRAVALEKNPIYLDTLAEAYFVNGNRNKAIEVIKNAIRLTKKNRDYYLGQLKKFQSSTP